MNGKNLLIPLLFLYHFLFTIIAFDYFLKNGGDANLYWFNNSYSNNKIWLDFFNYGSDFILFLNYPFVKILNFPILFGFILYSSVGFIAILQFYKLIQMWIGDSLNLFGKNVLPLLLFMPNLHFWTSILGKEPIVFLLIVLILKAFFQKKYGSLKMIIALILLLIIRPHFFLMIVFSFSCVLIISEHWSLKKKLSFSLITAVLLAFSFFLFLKISKINYINWARIKRFNDFSLTSLKYSNSYIPMIEYNYFEKFFAFYFRPLFFDVHNVYGFFISIENLITLIIHLVILFLIIKNFKVLKLDLLSKAIILYGFIAGLLFVQRYSDLGLIIRTKALIQPFIILALIKIVKEIQFNNDAAKTY